MKKTIAALLISISLCNVALADCDFKTGITPGPDHTFIYTEECHRKVGHMKQDLDVATQQVKDLTQAIQLKDLALTKSDERALLWMDTSDQLETRITKIDETYKHNEFLYFALGIVATVGTGLMVAKLVK